MGNRSSWSFGTFDTWNQLYPCIPPKKSLPGVLSFVRSNDRQQVVPLQEVAGGGIPIDQLSVLRWIDSLREEEGTPSDVIVHKAFCRLFIPKVLDRIGP
jgi:hypothetical protein